MALVCLTLCLISMIVFIVAKIVRGGMVGVVAKAVASVIFVISAIVAVITKTVPYYAYLIVAGLACGLVGDVLLGIFEKDRGKAQDAKYLNFGMLAFGIGHIFYIISISINSLKWIDSFVVPMLLAFGIGAIIALLIYVNSKTLHLDFGKFKFQSLAYSIVLCCAFVYSLFLTVLTKHLWPTFIALALFLASDLILSLMYFGEKNTKRMDIANKLTYYLAQIMFVIFLFFFVA